MFLYIFCEEKVMLRCNKEGKSLFFHWQAAGISETICIIGNWRTNYDSRIVITYNKHRQENSYTGYSYSIPLLTVCF